MALPLQRALQDRWLRFKKVRYTFAVSAYGVYVMLL